MAGVLLCLGAQTVCHRLPADTRGSNGTATAVLTGNFTNPNVSQDPGVITPLTVLRADEGGLNGFRAVSADPVASGIAQVTFSNFSHWTPEPINTTDLYFGIFQSLSFTFNDLGGFAVGNDMAVFRYDWSYNYHVDLNGLPAHPIGIQLPVSASIPGGYAFEASIEATFRDITTDPGAPSPDVILSSSIPLQVNPVGAPQLGIAGVLSDNDTFNGVTTGTFNDTGINVSGSLIFRFNKLPNVVGGGGGFMNIGVPPNLNGPWTAPPALVPEPAPTAAAMALGLGLFAAGRALRRRRTRN